MKEPKRRRSLSGAVLVMILTVMFVLIILLTATLTTVTTANQRIYTKFEENQAYYTARSALDVFTQNMLSDGNYIAQSGASPRPYIHGKNITSDYMKQGLGLQLDLYSITAQSGHNVTQKVLYDYAHGITVDDKRKDEYANYFGTKPTIGSPGTEGTDINEITYEVTFPTIANGGNAYGKLSDSSTATITVEVLERKYNLGTYTDGGTEKTIPDTDVDDFLNKAGSYTGVTDDMIAEAIANGNRKKDKMRIQITATTEYSGVEGIAVLILDSNEPPANNSSNAVTTFGGGSTDDMNILGGASMVGNVNWGNQGVVYGDVFAEADFSIASTGPRIRILSEGESFFVGGDFKPSSSNFQVIGDPTITDKNKRPFIYVGGKIISGNMSTNNFQNVDIIANGVQITGNYLDINGCDLYCKGTFDMSGLGPGNGVQSSLPGGNIYIDGDIIVKDDSAGKPFTVNKPDPGDASTWQVKLGVTNATIYQINGTIKDTSGNDLKANGAQIDVLPTTTTSISLPSTADILSPTVAGRTDVSLKSKSSITVTLTAGIKKEIKTHVDNYDTYYQKDASDNLILVGGVPVPKTPQVMADLSTMSDKTKLFTSSDTGITNDINTYLTTNNEMVFGENFQRTLDTSGGIVQCVLNESSFRNGIHIKGGGIVEMLVSGTYSNDTKILVDDDTTLKIVGDTTTSKISFTKFMLYNQTVLEAIKTDNPINVGNKAGCGIKVPKIYIYTTGNKEFHAQNDAFMTAYFYGPDTKLEFGNGGIDNKFNYNGIATTDHNGNSKVKIAVVGSILSHEIELPNSVGVAYINPDLDDDTPGDPIHQWQSFQYIRG